VILSREPTQIVSGPARYASRVRAN
jgi:hypothetical protein